MAAHKGCREAESGLERIADPREVATVRRVARHVMVKSALVALVATALLVLVR